ncbi:MAG: response regulator [Pirellulales bacterium]
MTSDQLRVLLIEDSDFDAKLIQHALTTGGNPACHVDSVASLDEAAECLKTTSYDVVLLDLGLSESGGIGAVGQFRSSCPEPPPLIVLTGLDDEQAALEALDNGAQDYVVKSDIDFLSRSIRHAVQRQQIMAQLKTANELLQEKNQRLSELYDTAQQFVDNVSHEFRTPLTVIREFTSIVRDGCDGPVTPKQIEHLDKVLHRTDDLALMVDDMLDISKLEAGLLGVWRRACRVTDLVATVTGLLRKRAESKKIWLSTQLAHDLPLVFCDEEKAQRVLMNLAVNAIKFTPEGGRVDIWVRPAENGSEIVIGVSDSGSGISPQNLEIIFERFQQLETNLRASTKGFGLGLNIAKELVSLNLGQMQVESAVGKGSTFSFTLPCNDSMVVFEQYVRRVSALTDSQCTFSFLTVSIHSDSIDNVAPVVDEYLQRSVRVQDLVIQSSKQTWVIVTSCQEREIPCLIDRLNQGWAAYARNCPRGEFPELNLEHRGTLPLAAGLSQLRDQFGHLLENRVVKRPAGGKVLVVDDDREVNSCLGVRLEAAGYEVLSAFDGEQGLATAIEQHPDAVVLDLRMPKKDGLTMLREMRSNEVVQRTPVVVLSANIRDQHRALEAGANYFVSKPYEADAILSAIESSLSERSLA